ncbi:helix-turn-helix domain-containing protein [Steroidobacter sp.]|uniref:helix-turn-helix domain-containing protein n=1 Tax=Steroidobacter sp. TaxID=1978227 RepID=UPI0039C9556A
MSAAHLNVHTEEPNEPREPSNIAFSRKPLCYPETAPRPLARSVDVSRFNLPQLWTEKQVAEYLEVTTQTIYRERKRGRLPYTVIGKKPRFTAEHIQAYLRNRECPATSTNARIVPTGTSSTMMSEQEKQNALALAREISSSRRRSSPRTSSDETMPS